MHYTITVSRAGKHLFSTRDQQIISEEQALEILDLFIEKFPVAEDYAIELVKWQNFGARIRSIGRP